MGGWAPRRAEGPGGPAALDSESNALVFFPFAQFHYENTRAQFFVEDASTASALKAVNYKILDQENRRVCTKGLAGCGWGLVLHSLGLGPGAESS